MIWSSFVLSLYCSRNFVAPENAICVMYSSTSSAVIPIPLSVIFSVFFSGSAITRIWALYPSGIWYSPITSSFFSLVIASQPLDTSSLKKMSWSEYSHFLIIGKILSLLIERLPCFSAMITSHSFVVFSLSYSVIPDSGKVKKFLALIFSEC